MADLSKLSDDDLLAAVGGAPKAAPTATPAAFAKQYSGLAQAVGQKLGVDPSLVLGQLGLETGWGKSVIPGTNNLGNIKDFSGGGTAARDNMTGSNDRYRQYATPDAFAADYADLLRRKYPGVVGAGADANRFIGGLRGYAEDPAYGQKLAGTIATVRKASPSLLARAGDAAASAISGTANAATPQDLSGISDDDLLAALASRGKGAAPQQPAPKTSILDQAGRTLGLTARSVGHGVADAVGLVANPLNATINTVGGLFGHNPHLQDADTLIKRGVDAVTPAPANDNQKLAVDIGGAVANPVNYIGGPIMAGAKGALSTLGRGAVAGAVTGGLQPIHQGDTVGDVATRVGAGAVGGAAGSAAGAAVGAVADKLATGINRIVSAVRANLPSTQAASRINADNLIIQAAHDQGIDLAAIPQSIRDSARQQVADALAHNRTLDPASLLRKAEADTILGTENSLTLGQATRDPMQFAREKNLRGVEGAGNALTERFANQNRGLINVLNQRGAAAAPGEFNAGQGVINSLQRGDAAVQGRIGGLYQQANAINGGDIPLDHNAFVNTARQNLTSQMRDLHLPPSVSRQLDRFESGDTPLNVSTAEQFKSILAQDIANAQAAGKGNVVHALGIVRDALDNVPPVPGAQANQGTAAIAAFDRARAAARARFGEIDNNPALRAVVNGNAVPDNFFQKHVINGNVGDVNALLRLVPDQGDALRSQVVEHLKQKALNGASDEVGVFSQSAFNKALNSIGDAKLNALFNPQEVAALKQIGRVAANIQAQPAGAAVNNSNSAAAVMNLFSQLSGKTGSLPGVNILRNSVRQFQDERAVSNALAARFQATANPSQGINALNRLLPYSAGIGAASAQPN
jgi:hypothetical protein